MSAKAASEITIARVIARLNVGGPAIQAILMTDAFRARGYRTLLLAGEVAAGEASMDYLTEAHDVRPTKIAGLSRSVSPFKDLQALYHLIRIFRSEKPLVVHTHTAKAGTLGRLAAILSGVPIRVHTFHGHVFYGYFSPLVTRFYLAIERMLAAGTDCIVTVSESQRQELTDRYRIAGADKIVCIPLGFDLDRFFNQHDHRNQFRNSLGCNPSTPLIGWIGRLTAIKSPGSFVDCAAEVHSRYPSTRFVMIGDGELRGACEERIAHRGLKSVVTIAGWQRHLENIYAGLDLVVSTSINEGTPVVLLEAMASGRTFVATSVGGVRDLMLGRSSNINQLEVFENGILVPPDSRHIANAINYLLERPELRKKMGLVGKDFVAARFSHHRLAEDLEKLYLSLARSKQGLQFTASPTRQEPHSAVGSSE